ncbi:MAG: DUF1573 domain-containing protein [Bacteroidia bacterium]|nr:DUF1573 domain-containing protein [Bacteroidia bacterium]MCX7763384.1 DUF1573 domain-containing protein [Bacteroidia bacterium]MDW8057269.1 DUF1573 domain-containing protein [Bacteroidia bacterium]
MPKATWSLILLPLGWAQITFDKTEHDFGEIIEGPPAVYTFTFKNTSSKPVKLTSVKASCGCTTPSWTQDPVPPGGTGQVQASYDTKGRPGNFVKTITVQHDADDKPIILTIKGVVKNSNQPQDKYSEVDANLAWTKRRESFGHVKSDQTPSLTFEVKNIGQTPVEFIEGIDLKPMFKLSFSPKVLAPNQEGKVIITLDGKAARAAGWKNQSGFYEIIRIRTSDPISPEKQLVVNGSFEIVYSPEELAKAPKAIFPVMEFDGGEVLEGQMVEYRFVIRNEGKSDLVIESVKASCGCTAVEPADKVLKPGASTEIIAKFDSRGRTGPQHKTITVETNDPLNSRVVLHLKAHVISTSGFGVGGTAPTSGSSY